MNDAVKNPETIKFMKLRLVMTYETQLYKSVDSSSNFVKKSTKTTTERKQNEINMFTLLQVFIQTYIYLLSVSYIYSINTTTTTHIKTYKICEDQTYCQQNGICYQNTVSTTDRFCSCKEEYHGTTCEKMVEKAMGDEILYGLAALCGLLFIALLITIYFLCRKIRKESDNSSIQKENSMLKPANPMYSHHTFLELNKKTSVSSANGNLPNGYGQNGHAYDIKDGGLTDNSSHTFQPDENDEKNFSNTPPNKTKDVVVNIEVEQGTEIKSIPAQRKPSVESKITSGNKNVRNDYEQDSVSGYSMSESGHNLIPPMYPRGEPTSQDGSDTEQNMDAIYREYYAARAAYGSPNAYLSYEPDRRREQPSHDPRKISRGLSPLDIREPVSHNHRRISSSPADPGLTIVPARHRQMTPGYDVRLHPAHAGRGYPTNQRHQQRHHLPQCQRREVRGRMRSDFADENGRVRSMGDLSLALEPDYRRRRARSVDELDNISYASSVENIHTGRVTRVSPRSGQQRSPRGRGIWARSGER